jgi:hypothetical protein
MHPDARLSTVDIVEISHWAKCEDERLRLVPAATAGAF